MMIKENYYFIIIEMSRVVPAKAKLQQVKLAHARKQIKVLIKSPALREAMLQEVERPGPDTGFLVNLMKDAHLRAPRFTPVATVKPVVNAVAPAPAPTPATATAPRVPAQRPDTFD